MSRQSYQVNREANESSSMKVLVAGSSLMSLRVVDALMHRHQVVWLKEPSDETHKTDQLNCEHVDGELTSVQSLAQAGADHVDVFIATANSDEQNIVACISARRLGSKKTICVVHGRSFLTQTNEGAEIARSLGIDQVVRPIEQLAQELISIVLVPGALEVEAVADGRVALFRYAVGETAHAVGKSLNDLRLPSGTRLVHVRRDDEPIIPRGDTVLAAGDKVIAVGTRDSLASLGEQFCEIKKRSTKDAAVIGGGRVGRAVTRGLIEAGYRVTVVETNAERCAVVAARTDALVLHGDGTDVDFLEQEHICEKPVVIAVTNSDEKNLLVSLIVKEMGSARVLTRADRLSNERLFERVGVDVVRSAKGSAIRNILRSVDEAESQILAELEHGEVCLLEITLKNNTPPIKVSLLSPPAYSVVGAVLRGQQTIIPEGRDTLQAGDHLFVFCAREDGDAVRHYYESPPPIAESPTH